MNESEYDAGKVKSFYDHQIETFKSMVSISTETFKFLGLLNGGAVAGIIATIDKLHNIVDMRHLRISIACFVLGLGSAAGCFVCSYATQVVIHNKSITKNPAMDHAPYFNLAIFFTILSLAAFGVGALYGIFGIKD